MLELAARAAQVLAAIGGAYLIALWFVLIVWTYRDIESRSSNVFTQIFSTLLVVLFFIPGVLLYLLLRPKQTLDEAFQRSLEEEYLLQDLEDLRLCPGCHRPVEADYVLCPQCQTQLREPCGGCGRLVDVKWPVCPYCALPQKERGDAAPKVAPPPARFIAPSARKRRERPEQVAATSATAPLPAGAAASNAVEDDAARTAARPFDRFRPRQPVAPTPAQRADRDPLAGRGSVGDELLRSLEQRESAPPIAPVAAPTPGSPAAGPAPVAPAAGGRAAVANPATPGVGPAAAPPSSASPTAAGRPPG